MLKWLLIILAFVIVLTVLYQFDTFVAKNSYNRKEDSVSMAEMGKIIKDIRIMGQERKEDIKEKEKQFGGDE